MNQKKSLRRTAALHLLLLGFLLGVSRGYVAVWEGEDPQPALITDTPVRSLPPEDQLALRSGIRLPDREALTRALEDYCS